MNNSGSCDHISRSAPLSEASTAEEVPALQELPILSSPAQVSSYTGVPINTLAFWRYEGSHIPFVKMGRLVRYRRQDILNFVSGNVYNSTAETKAAV